MLLSLLEFALVVIFSLGLIGYTMLQSMTSSAPPGPWPGILICIYASLPIAYLLLRLILRRYMRKRSEARSRRDE